MTSVFRKRHFSKQHQKQAVPTNASQTTIHCTIEKVEQNHGNKVRTSVKKGPMTLHPIMSTHFRMTALRWILLVISIYIVCGTIVVMIQDGTESLKNIMVYSIVGFFTFFMGYLGWIVAQDMLQILSEKKLIRNNADLKT